MDIVLVLGIAALLGLIPANIAKNKGHSFSLWWFYGWMLFIVAIIHVNFIEDKMKATRDRAIQPVSYVQSAPSTEIRSSQSVVSYPTVASVSSSGKRFQELYRLPSSYYLSGCPVIVDAAALLKDNQSGNVLAQIRLRNISEKPVISCKIAVKTFELNGTELQGVNKFSYLDLNAGAGETFGAKIPVYLPDPVTRRFSVSVIELVFADGLSWTSVPCEWSKFPDTSAISEHFQDDELTKQWHIEFGESSEVAPQITDGLFVCTCGAVNDANNERCYQCHRSQGEILSLFNVAVLTEKKEERIQAEFEKAEAERNVIAEAEAARKKIEEEKAQRKANSRKQIIKTLKITIPIVCIIGIIIALWPGMIKPIYDNYRAYKMAENLLNDGSYADAIQTFQNLGDYKDSSERILEAKYKRAEHYVENQEYALALSSFRELSSYSDSKDRLLSLETQIYQEAINARDNNQYRIVFDNFTLLSKYKYADAAKQLLTTHYMRGDYSVLTGDLKIAVDEYNSAKDYSDAKDKYISTSYLYACERAEERQYADAITYFKKCGNGYKDTEIRLQDAYYNRACQQLLQKDYVGAISSFANCKDYKDTAAKVLQAKYGYVVDHKNDTDTTTYNYLKDLTSARYSGAQAIYNELYAWKAIFIAINTSESDITTNKTTISKYNTWYVHFKIEGGPPNGSADLTWKTFWPDGSINSGKFQYKTYDGDTPWVNGWYETPAYGTTGKVTVTLYIAGESIGSASFTLTN